MNKKAFEKATLFFMSKSTKVIGKPMIRSNFSNGTALQSMFWQGGNHLPENVIFVSYKP